MSFGAFAVAFASAFIAGDLDAEIVCGGRELQLGEDVGDARLDRLARHRQPIANGLVGATFGHQGEDGALPLRQVVERDA